MSRGRNISAESLFKIHEYINTMSVSSDTERRNKAILEYAFIKNMSALSISQINDPLIVSFGNRNAGKPLSCAQISRIIKSYGFDVEKRSEYSPKSYQQRKELTAKKNRGEVKHPKICAICGSKDCLQLHHMIPIWAGGTNSDYNLVYLCDDCHKEVTREQQQYLKRVKYNE